MTLLQGQHTPTESCQIGHLGDKVYGFSLNQGRSKKYKIADKTVGESPAKPSWSGMIPG